MGAPYPGLHTMLFFYKSLYKLDRETLAFTSVTSSCSYSEPVQDQITNRDQNKPDLMTR